MIKASTRTTSASDRWRRSLDDPDSFWLEQAQRLDWSTPPTQAGDWSFADADFHVRWFADGSLNVAANCIDRHLKDRADQVAILPIAQSARGGLIY